MNLTHWQRLKRRLKLPGGSYTHPDGTIELDFHPKAGIDPTVVSEDVQGRKMAIYFARQRHEMRRSSGMLLFFWGLILFAWYAGLPAWAVVAVPFLVTLGFHLSVMDFEVRQVTDLNERERRGEEAGWQ